MRPAPRRCARIAIFSLIMSSLVHATEGKSSGIESPLTNKDEEKWESAYLKAKGLEADTESLLVYLSRQTPRTDNLSRIDEFVRQLAHRSFAKREEASKELIRVGPAALDALRRAEVNPDVEVVRRVQGCLEAIEKSWDPELSAVVVRRLLRMKPKELAPALVAFLPCAADATTTERIWFGLAALVENHKSIPHAIANALTDPVSSRRALAGCLVGRWGNEEQRKQARKLLKDADESVRLRTAQGLLARGEKASLPALISLLASSTVEVCWQAEELLRWAARYDAPDSMVGRASLAERDECTTAWKTWWHDRGEKRDFSERLKQSGNPLLVLLCDTGDKKGASGRVWLVGSDGLERWKVSDLWSPSDAHLLQGGRILIAESGTSDLKDTPFVATSGVALRELDGTIHWRCRTLREPTSCEPTPRGIFLVTERNGNLIEVDRLGEVVFSATMAPPRKGPYGYEFPQRLSDGRMICRLQMPSAEGSHGIVEVEQKTGKFVRQVMYGGGMMPVVTGKGRIRPIDGGNFLLAGLDESLRYHVVEVAASETTGKIIWTAAAPGASDAVRLPTGNTLAGGAGRLLELDAAGKPRGEVFVSSSFQRFQVCYGLLRLGFNRSVTESFHSLETLAQGKVVVLRQALSYLADFGSGIPGSIPLLEKWKKDSRPEIREGAGEALEKIKRSPVAKLLEQLTDKNEEIRRQAAWDLHEYKHAAWCVAPALIKALGDNKEKVRREAANILGGMEAEAAQVVPALIKAASDPVAEVRLMAVNSLGRLSKHARAAVPILLERLRNDKDANVKRWAAVSLSYIGPVDPVIIPALTEALKDPEARETAATGLGWIGPEAASSVPALITALRAPVHEAPNRHGRTRSGVLHGLSRMGPKARPALSPIIEVVREVNEERGTRCTAIEALAAIGDPTEAVIQVLNEATRDKDTTVAAKATKTIQLFQSMK